VIGKRTQLYFGNFIEIKLIQYLCLKTFPKDTEHAKILLIEENFPLSRITRNNYILDTSPNKTQNVNFSFAFCSDLMLCFITTDNNLFLVSTLVSGWNHYFLCSFFHLFYQLKVDLTKLHHSCCSNIHVLTVMTNSLDHPLNIYSLIWFSWLLLGKTKMMFRFGGRRC